MNIIIALVTLLICVVLLLFNIKLRRARDMAYFRVVTLFYMLMCVIGFTHSLAQLLP